MDTDTLIQEARNVQKRAYAPYSQFHVGAALIADDRLFTGCNVENLSFGLTICAERVAVGAAIAAGCRNFQRIVIFTDSKVPASPCGACRQVMAEFAHDLPILSVNPTNDRFETTLDVLLPSAKTGILENE